MPFQAKRAYEEVARSDGRRYLVDALWPRGKSKGDLQLTGWLRELAPSGNLREAFCHDPKKFPAFQAGYREELAAKAELLDRLVLESRSGMVTLVFGAREAAHSNAAVLLELLEERERRPGPEPADRRASRPRAVRSRRAGT